MKITDAEISRYTTQQYIDHFLNCTFPDSTPLTKKISLPEKGSHLITPRTGYTHHGIYIGGERVIHYSGLANDCKAGPIEEISLQGFHQNEGFKVKPHPLTKFSHQEIINRAKKRLNEKNYHLLYNNCEHFVNYCIYNVNTSRQVGSVLKTGAHTALKTIEKSNSYTATATAIMHSGLHIAAYIKGDISKEKLFEEISHSATVTTSSFYYAAMGQAAIPIPVVGAFIGAGVGYFIGNMLHRSGLIALGDSSVVREAKERRKHIESLCNTLIPEIKKSRIELEKYIHNHFSERKKEFSQAFSLVDNSLQNWDPDNFAHALEKLNNQFSASLQFKTFEEFDTFMQTEESFDF